jgi:hypothetical protein
VRAVGILEKSSAIVPAAIVTSGSMSMASSTRALLEPQDLVSVTRFACGRRHFPGDRQRRLNLPSPIEAALSNAAVRSGAP